MRTASTPLPPLLLAALTLLPAGACASAAPEPADVRARRLAQELLLVDTHIDVPIRLYGQGEEHDDVAHRTAGGHFDWERGREGGLDVAWMSIYVPARLQQAGPGEARAFADGLIDLVEGLERAAPERFAVVRSSEEARGARADGRMALALGIENGAAIEDDPAALGHFADRGVRYITLTHAEDNLICDSSYATTRTHGGLSPFGREVVAEMNRLGILVDVSHITDEAFDDVLEVTAVPVIASHSSCRHFVPGFERNLDDERIAALGRNGGVVQVNFGSAFLTAAANRRQEDDRQAIEHLLSSNGLQRGSDEAREAVRRWREQHPPTATSVADVADHVERVVALAGIDHVGIGSDYDGVGAVPVGLEDVSCYPALVAELLRRGWSEGDLRKLLGENLMRVWAAAERHAAARAGA
jgi:membrane dipeptidase